MLILLIHNRQFRASQDTIIMSLKQPQKVFFHDISILILFHSFDALPQQPVLTSFRNNALDSAFLQRILIYSGFNGSFRAEKINLSYVVLTDFLNTGMYNINNLALNFWNFLINLRKKQM